MPVRSGGMRLDVHVLGPVRVSAGDLPLRIERPLERALATRLALARGNGVSDDLLVRDLWGDDVARPVERLRVLASRLRRSLAGHAGVDRTAAGFALAADPVDLTAAERAIAAVHRARRDRDPATVRAAAAEALGHWRGDSLADLRAFPFARIEGERLDALRLDLQVERLEAELDTGSHTVGAELDRLADQHPLHERLVGLAALALYRSGRQADALDRLRRLRAALADELGVDPKQETAELELRLLRQEPDLLAPHRPAPARLPELHWPAPTTAFVGRDGEHAALVEAVSSPGLITLTGGPGLGKTRLAREIAATTQRSGRPVAWLALAPLRTPEDLTAALATAAGLETASGDPLARSAAALAGTLLVVDNAEHLIDPVASLVGELTRAADGLSVLVTSQRPLRLAAEELHQLTPLPPHAAATLFCSHSGVDPGPDVDAICAAVDRLPLGIELAAGLTRTLTLDQIAGRLDDRLRLLVGGPRDTGARHTSLRAALDWSHDLLSEPGRIVLRRLAVFAGGCTLEAAERVLAGDGIDAIDVAVLLTELAERSLVTVDDSTEQVRRFGLLETVRGYALERLRAAGEEVAVRGRHVDWCADRAANAEQFGRKDPKVPFGQQALATGLGADEANVRAAVEWCLGPGAEPARATEIVAPLWWYWWYRGRLTEARAWLRQSLAAIEEPAAPYAAGLHALSMLTRFSGEYDEALRIGADCLAAYQALGDDAGIAVALHAQALSSIALADFESTLRYADESERLARASDSGRTVGGALNCAGLALRNLGRLEEAAERFGRAHQAWTAVGHQHGIVVSTANLAIVAGRTGEPDRARELAVRSLRLARDIGYLVGVVDGLVNLGVLTAEADPATALTLLTVAEVQRAPIGAPLYIPDEIAARDAALRTTRAALGDTAAAIESAARRLDLDTVLDTTQHTIEIIRHN